jgi:anti-sigma factor RsiW
VTRECQQTRELLDSFLSGELTVETNHTVLRHLELCDACRTEADRRRETRQLLSAALKNDIDATAGDALRARIVNSIDADRAPMWRRAAILWPLAAAIVLTVSAALWWTRPVDAAAFEDSADNHVACALTLPEDAEYDAARIKKLLTGRFAGLADALSRDYAGYELVDAHICPYKGRDYAHAIYRRNGQLVSLFAEPSVRGSLPPAEKVGQIPDGGLPVTATALRGFVVDGVATGGHHLFVVSDQQAAISSEARDRILNSAAHFVRALESNDLAGQR